MTDPLPEASVDMSWANFSLSRMDKILPALKNWASALKTGGLLFSTHSGRDNLTELTSHLKDVGIACETPISIDMHNLGDMLANNGFYDSITDIAKLELSRRKAAAFRQNMETLGLWSALEFSDTQVADAFANKIFEIEGRLNITLETAHGHAAKGLVLLWGEDMVRFFSKGQG